MDAFDLDATEPLALEDAAEDSPVVMESVAYLVARVRHGDAGARDVLVRRLLQRARAVAMGVLRRPQDAEDIVQDSFFVAFERIDSCRDPARFESWLLQIVRNRSRNLLGARQLREDFARTGVDEHTNPAIEGVGLRGAISAALGELPPVQQRVVVLHDLEGWTHGEIAAALGLTEVNSRQTLFQARKALRLSLTALDPTDHERRSRAA